MIKLPPDGRLEVGGPIEAMAWGLEEALVRYLNMLSLADRPKGEARFRETLASHPAMKKVLGL